MIGNRKIYIHLECYRNRSIFETLLPRESNTKNTDAALLGTISYPGFATHDPNIYRRTKNREDSPYTVFSKIQIYDS